jgi:hypothetical protein
MANPTPAILITGEIGKVPEAYRAWFDPAVPLPAGVRFFPEQQTRGDVLYRIGLGIGFIIVGLLLAVFGLVLIIVPIIGIVFIFGGVMLLRSARTDEQTVEAQTAGKVPRYGVFITPETLLFRTSLDYTIVSRGADVQTAGGKFYYALNGEQKSFNLPKRVIGSTPEALTEAIQQWTKG